MTAERKHVKANGLNFVVTDQGDAGARPVVLLHGFPNNANMWQKQTGPLLKAGFRVIAPDLRGALGGQSDAPQEVEGYGITNSIVKDVAGIMDALHIQKAHIVGHDWGSALAWAFAGIYPDRTIDLIAMSVGHPAGYFSGDHRGDQKQKSWYMLLLNVPGKGEECISSGNMFDGIATKEAQAVEQPMFEELGMMEAMQKPGAVTAAINWYRANGNAKCFLEGHMCPTKAPSVSCDVLQIFPSGDVGFCTEGQAKTSGQFVKSPGTFRYERVETPSHFAPYTDPEPISKLVLSFFKRQ